jgi:predicted dehydrogenase
VIRVGIVDPDTSHGEIYPPLVNRAGDLRVVGVFDGGSVHPPSWVQEYAAKYQLEVAPTLADLVDRVDVAMVMGQDWDLHVERARPFLEAGKRVFIDKPIVGRMADVTTLLALEARTGTPVMAGSVLRYSPQIKAFAAGVAAAGPILSGFASGPHDVFNYGTHAAAMIGGALGPGASAVTYIGDGGPTELYLLEHRTGPPVVLQLHAPDGWEYSFFLALTSADHGVEAERFVCDDPFSDDMMGAEMEAFLAFARGAPPSVPLSAALEEVTICIAAAESRRVGRRVAIADLPPTAGFDGAAFARAYAAAGGWVEGAGGGSKQPVSSYSVG